MKKKINKITLYINGHLNRQVKKDKVFCIGLHKTGTTSLANLIGEYGFHPTHSTDWMHNESKIARYDFFSDGGSHFDNINEFNFRELYKKYPNAKFILQTRDTYKWVTSKLKHAGWNQNTQIEIDDLNKINHADWKYKSLLTIQKFIEHKFNYEKKVLDFFSKNEHSRLLVIDITNKENQKKEVEKLGEFLRLKSINTINLPHSNKRSNNINLSDKVISYVKNVITTNSFMNK